ncbi:hypothetical protein QZH41_017141 [Actinostola sp. cb2023]|nr:hypothetical protein QZH41_017141 [Actinostola sp. cb2023]
MPSITLLVDSPRSYRRSQNDKKKLMARGASVSWLSEQLNSANYIMVLDCRPFGEFARSHIQGAINLTIPSLMLRRLKKTSNFAIPSLITSDEGKESFKKNLPLARYIVLYDSSTKDIPAVGLNSALGVVIRKLSEDCSSVAIRLLEGGFTKFEEKCSSFCEAGEECGRPLLSLAGLTIRETNEQPPQQRPAFFSNVPTTPDNKKRTKVELAEILPRLFLGSEKEASNLELLKKNEISHVLNVTHDRPNAFAHLDDFTYKNLPVEDNWKANLADLFPEAFSFIDEGRQKGKGVLIHCLAGVSRSVTVTIAYLMLSNGLTLNEAYDFVKARKSNVSPNFNFMGQLLEFERSINLPHTPSSTTSSLSPASSLDDSELDTSDTV